MRRDTTSLAIIVTLATLGLWLGCHREAKGREILLKYISFGARTYNNITIGEFERDHDYDIALSASHPFARDLLAALQAREAEPKFEEDIRLIVETGGADGKKQLFVNSHGIVMLKQGDQRRFFKVGVDELRTLHERIVAFHGVCDLNPSKTPKY